MFDLAAIAANNGLAKFFERTYKKREARICRAKTNPGLGTARLAPPCPATTSDSNFTTSALSVSPEPRSSFIWR